MGNLPGKAALEIPRLGRWLQQQPALTPGLSALVRFKRCVDVVSRYMAEWWPGSGGVTAGLEDLKGLIQRKRLCDSARMVSHAMNTDHALTSQHLSSPGTFLGWFWFPLPTGHACSLLLQLVDQNQLPHGKQPNLGRRTHQKLCGAKGGCFKGSLGMILSIATMNIRLSHRRNPIYHSPLF